MVCKGNKQIEFDNENTFRTIILTYFDLGLSTVNIENMTEEPLQLQKWGNVKYFIYQIEATKEGNKYYIAYLEFKNPIKFRTLIKKFPGSYIERRWGNKSECQVYCTKKEFCIKGPWEGGNSRKE